mgnify:CR=1 FL=1
MLKIIYFTFVSDLKNKNLDLNCQDSTWHYRPTLLALLIKLTNTQKHFVFQEMSMSK